ncbi:MAG: phosphatidylserine decarboxylase [Rhodospirillales bacterium]|nr:phosphatidylserine decarboxylase [Rhodospirillales bacterium]
MPPRQGPQGQRTLVFRSIVDTMLVPIQRAGWPFVAAFALATVVLFAVAQPLGWLGLVLTAWCTYFFRDPDRMTPIREGLVVSPADGLVQMVTLAAPPPELGLDADPRLRISIFMNVFDVHVNRIPIDGAIARIAYVPGAFVNASLDKASEKNERNGLLVRTGDGRDIAVVQIAGLVARRIACWLAEGQAVRAGQRLGMIRFGSRVDVYLPEGVSPLVGPGQRSVAGETVLADLQSAEPPRQAERR